MRLTNGIWWLWEKSWENRRKHVEEMEDSTRPFGGNTWFSFLLFIQCHWDRIHMQRQHFCSFWLNLFCTKVLVITDHLWTITGVYFNGNMGHICHQKKCWEIPVSLNSMLKFTAHVQIGNYFNNAVEKRSCMGTSSFHGGFHAAELFDYVTWEKALCHVWIGIRI